MEKVVAQEVVLVGVMERVEVLEVVMAVALARVGG
jgi:hypothetical protein